ncbi:uncharacterized protein LOC120601452 isoform X2 [Pteropus medius]|uniref:uncharacterized protein LOC120601452 isoform X2 n=1 Tax=Pteropus vampyrus TaxID=132908 RepID=UPI00196A3EF4|nr:uncharacterized protein LOC120601452 isoform X2 [Pteropus giganteus]
MQTLLPAPPRSPGHGRGRQPGTLSKKHIRVHLNTGSKGRVSLGASPSFWRNRVLSPGGAGRGHPSRGPLGSWPGSGGQLEEVDDPAEGLDAPARGLPVGEAAEVAPLHQGPAGPLVSSRMASTHAPSPYTLMALTQLLAQPRLWRSGQSSWNSRHWPVKLQPSKISRRKCSPCCGPHGVGGRRKASSAESPHQEQKPVWAGALGTPESWAGGRGCPLPRPLHPNPVLLLLLVLELWLVERGLSL